MEKDGEIAGASRHPDRNRYGSIRRILSGICEMERSRGVYYTARGHRKDPERILAAGTAGIHRTDISEDYE